MSELHSKQPAKHSSSQHHTRFDRRHLVLLLAALACIAGLVLWVAELDLDLDSGLTPQRSPSPTVPSPARAPQLDGQP
jgi:hypothetical protein